MPLNRTFASNPAGALECQKHHLKHIVSKSEHCEHTPSSCSGSLTTAAVDVATAPVVGVGAGACVGEGNGVDKGMGGSVVV